MTDSTTAPWQKNLYLVYLVSIIAWAVATATLLVKFFDDNMLIEYYITSTAVALILMAAALPGLVYFLWQSTRLRSASPERALKIYNQIMVVQHPAGIIAIAGGFLGLLPFLINVGGLFTTHLQDLWLNASMTLPWLALYGFIATYVCSLVIGKARKKVSPKR